MALSAWASQVVGTWTSGSPRANSAAAVPARSPIVPPPTAISGSSRSTRCAASHSRIRSRRADPLRPLAGRRPSGTHGREARDEVRRGVIRRRSTTATPSRRERAEPGRPPSRRAPSSGPIGWWRSTSASNRRRPRERRDGARSSSSATRFGRAGWRRAGGPPRGRTAHARPARPPARSAPYGWRVGRAHASSAGGRLRSLAGGDVQPGDGAVVPERPSVQRVDDRAAAGRDDRSGHRAGLERRPSPPRRGTAGSPCDGCSRRTGIRCGALDQLVGVDERAAEPLGDEPPTVDLPLPGMPTSTMPVSHVRHRSRARRRAPRA